MYWRNYVKRLTCGFSNSHQIVREVCVLFKIHKSTKNNYEILQATKAAMDIRADDRSLETKVAAEIEDFDATTDKPDVTIAERFWKDNFPETKMNFCKSALRAI